LVEARSCSGLSRGHAFNREDIADAGFPPSTNDQCDDGVACADASRQGEAGRNGGIRRETGGERFDRSRCGAQGK
jgi:hypothetical protein